ncbi:hypothetical protein KKB18_11165, partial [bacterium]|nr:hypothetical protein [bacterium]
MQYNILKTFLIFTVLVLPVLLLPVIAFSVSDEFQVNTTIGGDQWRPVVAMDDNGNFVIAWEGYSNTIFARRFDNQAKPIGDDFQVGDGNSPSIAMNGSGEFIIAWYNTLYMRTQRYEIYARQFNQDGSPKGPEFMVSADSPGVTQRFPSCGIDSNGSFVIVWKEDNESNDKIYVKKYDSGGNLLKSFQVDTSDVEFVNYPKVAMNESGNFVITWAGYKEDREYDWDIYVQRYDSLAEPVEREFRVNTDSKGWQNFPAVAMNDMGMLVIVWQGDQIYAQLFDSTGVRSGDEFLVNSEVKHDKQYPSVAIDNEGKFIIAWETLENNSSSGPINVYAQRFDKSGERLWIESKLVTKWDYSKQPSCAADPLGNIVIARTSKDTKSLGIIANYYGVNVTPTPTATWTPPTPTPTPTLTFSPDEFQVNTSVLGDQWRPVVAMNRDGNYIIVWESLYQDGSGSDIFARIYDNDANPVTDEFLVNSYTRGYQYLPAVAMGRSGEFVIAWHMLIPGKNKYGVYARKFSDAGIPTSTDFLVSDSSSTYNQLHAACGMDSLGNFVIAWNGNDVSYGGILAKKY